MHIFYIFNYPHDLETIVSGMNKRLDGFRVVMPHNIHLLSLNLLRTFPVGQELSLEIQGTFRSIWDLR